MGPRRRLVLLVLAGWVGIAAFAGPRKVETGFLNREVTLGHTTYRYQVYVPADWSPKRKWPLILFLHGVGERGGDGLFQTEVGLGSAIRRNPERFPCVVVFPQCRVNATWLDPAMDAQAVKALEETIEEFHGDRERIYLTGLSMGGYGTWSLATRHAGKFAALAPICGGIRPTSSSESSEEDYRDIARKVGKTPVWVFHGSADPVVPVSESRRMVEALRAVEGNVKYTEYEGVGHNSWDKTYSDPDFLAWLLAQRLN